MLISSIHAGAAGGVWGQRYGGPTVVVGVRKTAWRAAASCWHVERCAGLRVSMARMGVLKAPRLLRTAGVKRGPSHGSGRSPRSCCCTCTLPLCHGTLSKAGLLRSGCARVDCPDVTPLVCPGALPVPANPNLLSAGFTDWTEGLIANFGMRLSRVGIV